MNRPKSTTKLVADQSDTPPMKTRSSGVGQACVSNAFKAIDELDESPMAEEIIQNWLEQHPDPEFAAVIVDTLLEVWRAGAPSRDVKCIMRFYNDPNTRLEERQDVATFGRGDFEIVYMMKGINLVTQGPRFGYESNQDAQEDLPKALNPVTNDVPAVAAFNRVFPMGYSNCDVAIELIPDLLRAIWNRRPTIIIPFGQSGSGKTYTLEGDDDCPGVIPRLIDSVILMVEAVRPATFIVMAQFAQVYKDKRIDLLVEDGDIVFGKLRPWPIMIIHKRERKLGYTAKNGQVYEGFITDDEMTCYDSEGRMIGKPIKEYKKTLAELICQTLKEKHTPQDLRQFQYDESKPEELFQRLGMRMMGVQKDMLLSISEWFRSSASATPVVQKAQRRALQIATDLIDFVQAKSFVSKSDFSCQVQHVPIDGFCLKRINSTKDFITTWRAASDRRVTAATSNNETSSRATLTGKLSIVWSHPMYVNQNLPNALSYITFDDLPGAESAGDFSISDPLYKTRTLETNDIGSDLLKLGLLLGRQTAPSGRKVSEDVRSIDDKQAVTAIILTGKTNHSDVAQTLRFAHHAGTTLVQEMHLREAVKFLQLIGGKEVSHILNAAKEIWEEVVPEQAPELLQRLKRTLGTGPITAKKLISGQLMNIMSGVISLTICRMDSNEDDADVATANERLMAERHVTKKLGAQVTQRGATQSSIGTPPTRSAPARGKSRPIQPPSSPPSKAKSVEVQPGRGGSPRKSDTQPFTKLGSPRKSETKVVDSALGHANTEKLELRKSTEPEAIRKFGEKDSRRPEKELAVNQRAGRPGIESLRDTNREETRAANLLAKKAFEKRRCTITILEDEKHIDQLRPKLDALYERVIRRVSRVEKMLHKKFDQLLQSLDMIVAQSSDDISGMEGDILEMEAGLSELEGSGLSFTRADLQCIREVGMNFVTLRNHTSDAIEIIENMAVPTHERVSVCKMHDGGQHGDEAINDVKGKREAEDTRSAKTKSPSNQEIRRSEKTKSPSNQEMCHSEKTMSLSSQEKPSPSRGDHSRR
eukprot:GEMP01004348.1.p1 GENE.GEMP01004348.1~~GEMP01004348.1.p1  ORF type:complete len:1043 (+),score=207.09 GEMP01004348.1:141-3269(+)